MYVKVKPLFFKRLRRVLIPVSARAPRSGVPVSYVQQILLNQFQANISHVEVARIVRQAFPEARHRMDHATKTYVYDGIAFAPVSVGAIAQSTDASDLRNHPSPYASKIRIRRRGVHVQSACLTCRSHKEKSTRFESSKRNLSNSSEATCLKRLCGDANQLAISRNDSVVRDGTFAGVRLLFSWSRACFVARFTPFFRERHRRHDASSKPSFVWHLASAGQRESRRGG